MKFQRQIDSLHKIRLLVGDDLKNKLEDVILELEDEIRNDDLLNTIDYTNVIDVIEVAKDYLPPNYKILICDNLNSECEVSDFAEENNFVRVL